MRQCDQQWDSLLAQLGLCSGANWESVQARYRQLVLALHPDVNPSHGAAERFRGIAEVYTQLCRLREERMSRSAEHLSRMYDDPKIRQLPMRELEMRLRYSASAEVRAAAACLLGARGGREVRRLLVAARRDPKETVRRVALESLGEVGRLGDMVRFLPAVEGRLLALYLHSLLRVLFRDCKRGGQTLRSALLMLLRGCAP